MSADSYSACPRCLHRLKTELVELETKAADFKSFNTPQDWAKAHDEANEKAAFIEGMESGMDESGTFREYYETYLTYDPPTLNYRYGATCDVCEFEHQFTATDAITGWENS